MTDPEPFDLTAHPNIAELRELWPQLPAGQRWAFAMGLQVGVDTLRELLDLVEQLNEESEQ